ncbi:MAG: hypothetical protein EPO26_05730 [Chloroflexota bacterium]|nr:MAG: hypothetical protein EPO26_05730 [Chloroflexota bacterium]
MARPIRQSLAIGSLVALPLPLIAEVWLRTTSPIVSLLQGCVYFGAVLLFAFVAPGLAVSTECPPSDRIRWPFLAVGAAIAAYGASAAMTRPRDWTLTPIWLAGLAFALAATYRRDTIAAWLGTAKRERTTTIAVISVVIVATGLRLYHLGTRPIIVDELAMMPFALELGRELETWRQIQEYGISLFAANQGLFSQLALTSYLSSAAFAWGGIDIGWMRVPSALIGVVEVGLVYVIGRVLVGSRAALIAALVLATMAAHLEFSRNGQRLIEASVAWSLVALLMSRGFARKSAPALTMAGVVLSSSLFIYWAMRPGVAFGLGLLALAWLDPRLRGRWLVAGSIGLLAGFAIGAGPMLAPYIKDPALFLFRSEKTSWLSDVIAAFRATGEWAKLWPIWEHVRASLLGYNLYGSADNHYRPERGLLVAIPAALMFAGAAIATVRLSDWRLRTLAVWFWGATTALMVLSDVTPITHRALPTLPVAALLVGLAADRALVRLGSVRPAIERYGQVVVGAAILIAAVQEAAFYTLDYATRDHDRWQDQLTRYMLSSSDQHHLLIYPGISPVGMELNAEGKPFQWASELRRRLSGEDLGRYVDQLPDASARPNGISFLFPDVGEPWIETVARLYPGAERIALRSSDPRLANQHAWTVLRIGSDEQRRYRGLRARGRDARGVSFEFVSDRLEIVPGTLPPEVRYPVEVTWDGWVRVARGSGNPHDFRSLGTVQPAILVDERRIEWQAAARGSRLPLGGHYLRATAHLNSPDARVGVTWDDAAQGTQRPFPESDAMWWPGDPRVEITWQANDGGPVLQRDFDIMIADNRFALRRPRDAGHVVRWAGTIRQPSAATYDFEVVSDGPVRLEIDDAAVWPRGAERRKVPGGALEERTSRVTLAAGDHKIVVDRLHREGGKVALQWRRGSEPFTLVPVDAFVPLVLPTP